MQSVFYHSHPPHDGDGRFIGRDHLLMVHSLAKQCFSGSQYSSRDFRALLLTNDCIQSMSRRGLAQYTAHGIMQWLKASFIH